MDCCPPVEYFGKSTLSSPLYSVLISLLQARNRRLVLNHIPENKYSSRKYEVEIIHLSDMQHDCALLRAQIDLVQKDPSLLTSQGESMHNFHTPYCGVDMTREQSSCCLQLWLLCV